jgi:C-terminal processing protease CtpA/Prc
MFRSPGPGTISAPGTLGNIGGGILRRFRVIFDYPRSRMILEPNTRFGEPFDYDMSGLGLRAAGAAFDRVIVARVLDASPAVDAGVREGDELARVDGTRAIEIGLDSLRATFRKEGEEHRLELIRAGEKLEVTLKTRRII